MQFCLIFLWRHTHTTYNGWVCASRIYIYSQPHSRYTETIKNIMHCTSSKGPTKGTYARTPQQPAMRVPTNSEPQSHLHTAAAAENDPAAAAKCRQLKATSSNAVAHQQPQRAGQKHAHTLCLHNPIHSCRKTMSSNACSCVRTRVQCTSSGAVHGFAVKQPLPHTSMLRLSQQVRQD